MWPFVNKKKIMDEEDNPSYLAVKEVTEEKEIEKISIKLKEVLNNTSNDIIILCVGSDRSTGDSLGPIVGSMLKESKLPIIVYGTLEEPVHALNIHKILKKINQTHPAPFILGIDACLGDKNQIGSIILKKGPLIPGSALNKVLPGVGDYHLKAVVNSLDSYSPVQSLNSTRLFTVIKLAEIMTKIISRAVLEDKSVSIRNLLMVED
ncbi:spore protease YyaC [Paenibacillus sp. BSR1-1]|uniref:spore protease YyaC n=1 Tax=Paenibacillus sp. BSR1-1 TaxID=3020845 RepID=UPI0025AFB4F8|nr:spore protease YyaC [Paenibacillus sp. BSR1-1]MDN3016369.1 spore protease YyaC [Paenibacillus sp. BSR1-1]